MSADYYVRRGQRVVFHVHPSAFILAYQLAEVVIAVAALATIFILSDIESVLSVSTVLVASIIAAVGLFIAFVTFLSWYKTNYILTKSRVRYFSGILGVQNKDMTLDDIQNVQYKQTFMGTIFNYGDIFIRSAAEDTPIVFKGIAQPRIRAELLRKLAKV